MSTLTRQQAAARLQAIQAQMYVLTEEAKTLAGFLNGSAAEDQERAQTAEQSKETKEPAEV